MLKAAFGQGAGHAMFAGRLHAGPIIAQVVEVGAVENHVDAQPLGDAFHLRVQLGLAVIAAIRGVAEVVGLARTRRCSSTSWRMPISSASRRASSNSPAARLALVPVTATARSPSASCAALATTVLSTPAEKATAQATVAADQLRAACRVSLASCDVTAKSDAWVHVSCFADINRIIHPHSVCLAEMPRLQRHAARPRVDYLHGQNICGIFAGLPSFGEIFEVRGPACRSGRRSTSAAASACACGRETIAAKPSSAKIRPRMARHWVGRGGGMSAPGRSGRRRSGQRRRTGTASKPSLRAVDIPCELGGGVRDEADDRAAVRSGDRSAS